jgi:RNA polymerase sigma-70 factor, ECF subfamily
VEWLTDTPGTLLNRLCTNPAPADWESFVRLFTPLLERWAVRFGVRESDTEDLLQELFVLLIRKLPEFRYDPSGSFRAWLWTTFRHSVLAWYKREPRAGSLLVELEALGSPDPVVAATEAEYRNYVLGRVMGIIRADFPERTWRIFTQVAVEGRPGAEVAHEFGISVNAVYLARGRVLARLREELAGLDR